jgi:hypothetical protein
MATITLTTFNDLVGHVVDYLGAAASAGDLTRDARRAVLNAYRELASASIWSYYYQRGRLNTFMPFQEGTISYSQATQTVTLTTGTGLIQQATNTSPIVITSAAHGLSSGGTVTISGVLGNTAANGTWVITVVDANDFSLNGSVGNGTYTSGGTWTIGGFPPWAANAMISFNTGSYPGLVAYQVVANPTPTTLVLADASNPGEDAVAGQVYTLYCDTFPLPADCLAINRMIMVNQAVSMWYESPGIWLERQRIYYSPAMPRSYTITGHPNFMGSMAIRFFPPPDNNYVFDFIYQRRPRAMVNAGYSTGKVSTIAGQPIITGVGTNWTSWMIGQCIRIGTDNVNIPTGPEGNFPSQMERVVVAVNSPTSLTLDAIATQTVGPVTHIISDIVDIEAGAMLTALLRCCEKQASISRAKTSRNLKDAEAAYKDALILAREADSRSFAIETVGNSHMYPYRLANMPSGPDIP